MIKMMVVEDEKILREGICRIGNWETHGIEICGAVDNGVEALKEIEAHEPDIILTDVVMPVMDGIELTRRVHEQYPDIKVILLSGHEEFEYVKKAMEYKACSYLLKPAKIEKLIEVVSEVRDEIQDSRKKQQEEELLQKKLEQSIPILREHYMNQLLNGRENDETKIMQQFQFLNIGLQTKNIAVIICEIDRETKKQELSRITLLQLRELCEEIIGNEYRCVVFEDLKDRIVIVLNYPQNVNHKDIVTYLQGKAVRIQNEIEVCRGETVSIGIGRITGSIRYLSKAYREAEYALNYRFFMGNGSVIYIGDIEKEEHRDSFFLTRKEEEIITCVKAGDTIGTEHQLEQYFLMLSEYSSEGQDYIYEKIQMFVSYLLNFLKGSNMEAEDGFFGEMEKLSWELRKKGLFTTFAELERKICAVILHITEKINDNRVLRNEGIIEKAKKYVQQNLSGDVSLIMVADAVYVSPNYLSFLFKENGENFKDYVVRVKMERATELMEQGNYTLNQIAQELGYKDGRYFSKVYKKYQEK